ncbi:phosphate transport system substrate-binding protein [Marmoricola sp. URHA0025 HA25]
MNFKALLRGILALGFVAAVAAVPTAGPAHADSFVPISGAGSTWSQVAVDAWRADVRASGIVVNFAGTGSTDGRAQFIQSTVDFANTEIPFQNPPEPGQQAEVPTRKYAYLPIVAGGTSFMYNLTVGGQRVRDLRLSGTTLAKIFTGQISNWNDPLITKDYGKQLPSTPIIPVVRSDGAGASAQFALYMRGQAPDVYCPFIRSKLGLSGTACPSVSFYPAFGNSKAQVGSNGVANYVSASYGQGAIGYVEYAYAKRINFPVASLLNKAGYFAQPTAGNVAVALTQAKINADLTQNLDSVYTNPDPRAYPMSSYSYMVVPTSTDEPFNTDKGKTLSTFVNYFLCTGQQKADKLGYSPLPKNLVLAGFDQVRRIPGYVEPPPISQCNNPALQILQTAPQPDPCSKVGATCTGKPGASTKPGANAAGTPTTATGAPAAAGPAQVSDPTGVGAATDTGPPAAGAASDASATAATAVPVSMVAEREAASHNGILYALSALLLALVVLLPPLLVHRGRRG